MLLHEHYSRKNKTHPAILDSSMTGRVFLSLLLLQVGPGEGQPEMAQGRALLDHHRDVVRSRQTDQTGTHTHCSRPEQSQLLLEFWRSQAAAPAVTK